MKKVKNRINSFIEKAIGNSFCYNTAVYAICSYQSFENKIEEFYRQSRTGKCFFSFFHFLEIIFRNSLIGRLTEIPEDDADVPWEILLGSRVFQYMAFRWNRMKKKALMSVGQSQFGELCYPIAGSFFNRPLQIGGQVVLVAVVFNSLLSFTLEADVSLFGIMMRAMLFMLAFFCLFSECDWRDLKKTSCVARKYFEPLNERHD